MATRVPANVRDRLAIALDTGELDHAVAVAKAVQPSIGIAKVGLQLFSAAGRDAVQAMRGIGMSVFLDVKLHDIPNTVHGASKVLGSLGVQYLTVHAAGGVAMLQAAMRGLDEGADQAGFPAPMVLAVTILTSEPSASPDVLSERLRVVVEAGCRGVVCAAAEVPAVKSRAAGLTTVVPGIRPTGVSAHDQGRVATPAEAVRNGADVLVIGRAVTASNDPATTAEAIAGEVSQAV